VHNCLEISTTALLDHVMFVLNLGYLTTQSFFVSELFTIVLLLLHLILQFFYLVIILLLHSVKFIVGGAILTGRRLLGPSLLLLLKFLDYLFKHVSLFGQLSFKMKDLWGRLRIGLEL
jgi:hypothetical protein